MLVHHLKPNPSKTIIWSKGTSTELFIYPPTADFQKRDFLFRISLATVEAEESEFTPLSDITRILMLLEGRHTLIHEGHHTKTLLPFDQDIFQGDWQTSSQGKAANFNLMCRAAASGSLKYIHAEINAKTLFALEADFELIYLHSGAATYDGKGLKAGDCLLIENGKQLTLSCTEECHFVQASISC